MIGTGRLNGPHSVVPKDYKMDGDSLLCLLGGGGCRGGKWRPYLDLEHYKVTDTTHIKAMSFCCRQFCSIPGTNIARYAAVARYCITGARY